MKKIFFILIFVNILFAATYDGVWMLGFNCRQPAVSKVELRKAIARNLNRRAYVAEVQEQYAGSPIYPTENFQPRDLFEYNPQNVKTPQTLTIVHTDGVKTRKISELIRQDLAKAGITVNLMEVPMDDSWGMVLQKGNYDCFLMGFKADYQGDLSSYLRPLFLNDGYANFMHYENRSLEALLNGSSYSEKDLRDVETVLAEDVPVIPIFYIEKIQ
jgi:ABC-type transport system substrate-binding protein